MKNIQYTTETNTMQIDLLLTSVGSFGFEVINHNNAKFYLSRDHDFNSAPIPNACLVFTGSDGQDFIKALREFLRLIDSEAPIGSPLAYPDIVSIDLQSMPDNLDPTKQVSNGE